MEVCESHSDLKAEKRSHLTIDIQVLSTIHRNFPERSEIVENRRLIPNDQFGFRQKHSTIHQLVRVENCVKSFFNAK